MVRSDPFSDKESLQQRYAPNNTCFGCGPANPQGLQLRSFCRETPTSNGGEESRGEFETIAEWQPQRHHEAFPGFLNGGIISTLLDCHCNWAAIAHAIDATGTDEPPCTVTAKLNIQFLAPTPTDKPIQLSARVTESDGRKFSVKGAITANNVTTATCEATFVAVQPGHPAYHRWS